MPLCDTTAVSNLSAMGSSDAVVPSDSSEDETSNPCRVSANAELPRFDMSFLLDLNRETRGTMSI